MKKFLKFFVLVLMFICAVVLTGCNDNSDDLISLEQSVTDLQTMIEELHEREMKVGIAIKPDTSIDEIMPYIDDIDLVLVMTVEPGFGGQEFMHDCAMKIPLIKEKAPENLIIQVDGGINNLTAKICTSLGANSLVAGSYIYGAEDYKKAIDSLK
jgi:ribulose-phosphate 3-epimerase